MSILLYELGVAERGIADRRGRRMKLEPLSTTLSARARELSQLAACIPRIAAILLPCRRLLGCVGCGWMLCSCYCGSHSEVPTVGFFDPGLPGKAPTQSSQGSQGLVYGCCCLDFPMPRLRSLPLHLPAPLPCLVYGLHLLV
jgi:hypothetical protein